MRKTIVALVLLLSSLICFAQVDFTATILKGDVKVRENFYEMALKCYQQALQDAQTPEQVSLAENRILVCKELMAPKEDKFKRSKLVYRGQYLESGDLLCDDGTVATQRNYPWSLYSLEIYREYIKVLWHKDYRSGEPLGDSDKELCYKYALQDNNFRYYSSSDLEESFAVSKSPCYNSFGKFYKVIRVKNDRLMILYSSPEMQEALAESEIPDEEVASDVVDTTYSEEIAEDVTRSVFDSVPVQFKESWYQNLDEDYVRLSDSRNGMPIRARDVCWLVIRNRYECPFTFSDPATFDVRIYSPDKMLVESTSVELETIPGGGVLSFMYGGGKPGVFKSGDYLFEFWCKDVLYHTVDVKLL